MENKHFNLALLVAVVTTPLIAQATTYEFTVTCQHGAKVVAWHIGAFDLGREVLRVSTGTSNPNCSVSNFNRARDAQLPVEVREGAAAMVQSIPLIGEILKKLFVLLF